LKRKAGGHCIYFEIKEINMHAFFTFFTSLEKRQKVFSLPLTPAPLPLTTPPPLPPLSEANATGTMRGMRGIPENLSFDSTVDKIPSYHL
jgi:hypothetical protein